MTPAVRLLQAGNVPFALHRYGHSPDADSFGLEAAQKLGVSPECLFKTLVAKIDGKQLVLALVPAAARLDLKKLAAVAGGKRAEMAEPQAAERATGYVVGGISPLGGKRSLPAYVDASLEALPSVFVSAGQRGLQLELAPADLLRLLGARTAEIATADFRWP
jgi:Cys-tRNA(Pro)/Cys-tRNA(Cys) deacylase